MRSLQRQNLGGLILVLVAILCYGVAYFSLVRVTLEWGLGSRAQHQALFTILAMMLSALVFVFFRIPALRVFALLLQFLGGLFLGQISADSIWPRLLWIVPLALQMADFFSLELYLLCSFGLFLSHFHGGEATVAWGHTLPAALERESLGAGVATAVFLLLLALLRWFRERLARSEQLIGNLKENILKLTRANYDFQRYASDTEELTLERERLRIAREIHDTVGYTMTTLRMMLEAGIGLIDESPLEQEMLFHKARDMVERGHREIRVSLRELRERESDRPRGLMGLKNLIGMFMETTGVHVNVEWGNLPWDFPDDVEAALYRFVQEGMSNSLSHGNATQIDIQFRREDGEVWASLSDDGVGADVLIEGMGLSGMRERIEGCGGTLLARNTTAGFFLTIQLPLEAIGEANPIAHCG